MKNASDKASLHKGQHTPSVLHEMANSERNVTYLSRLPALSHIIDEGGQKGGKTAGQHWIFLDIIGQIKSLNRLVRLTEGFHWWRWGRVELPVQTNLP